MLVLALTLAILKAAARQLFLDEGTIWNRFGYVLRVLFCDIQDEYRETHLYRTIDQIYSMDLIKRLKYERQASAAYALLIS